MLTTPTLPRPRATLRAAGLALGMATALGLARFAYGQFIPAMADDLAWTFGQAGGLTTANGAGYLLGAVATADLTRRFGPTAVFRGGMVATAAAVAATGISGDYLALAAARGIAGFGGAAIFITGAALAARWGAAAGSAIPVAVYFAGAGAGIAVTGGLVPLLLNDRPGWWPIGWLALGCLAAAAVLGSWRAAAAPTGAPRQIGGDEEPHGRERRRAAWPLYTAYLLFGAGYIAYITFVSTYLEQHRAPVVLVAATWVLIGVSAMVGPVAWSRPVESWPPAAVLAAILTTAAAAAVLPLLSRSGGWIAISAVLFGSAFMAVPAAVTAVADRMGGDVTARLSVLTVLFAVGQAVGPWASGLLADQTSVAAVLVWTAGICGVAAAVCLVWWGHRERMSS